MVLVAAPKGAFLKPQFIFLSSTLALPISRRCCGLSSHCGSFCPESSCFSDNIKNFRNLSLLLRMLRPKTKKMKSGNCSNRDARLQICWTPGHSDQLLLCFEIFAFIDEQRRQVANLLDTW